MGTFGRQNLGAIRHAKLRWFVLLLEATELSNTFSVFHASVSSPSSPVFVGMCGSPEERHESLPASQGHAALVVEDPAPVLLKETERKTLRRR